MMMKRQHCLTMYLIVAEDNSSVTYVENYISTVESRDNVFNIVTEVIAKPNARVQYGAVDTSR